MIPIFFAIGICNTQTIGSGKMRRYKSVKQEQVDSTMIEFDVCRQFGLCAASHQDCPGRGMNR